MEISDTQLRELRSLSIVADTEIYGGPSKNSATTLWGRHGFNLRQVVLQGLGYGCPPDLLIARIVGVLEAMGKQ